MKEIITVANSTPTINRRRILVAAALAPVAHLATPMASTRPETLPSTVTPASAVAAAQGWRGDHPRDFADLLSTMVSEAFCATTYPTLERDHTKASAEFLLHPTWENWITLDSREVARTAAERDVVAVMGFALAQTMAEHGHDTEAWYRAAFAAAGLQELPPAESAAAFAAMDAINGPLGEAFESIWPRRIIGWRGTPDGKALVREYSDERILAGRSVQVPLSEVLTGSRKTAT